MRDAQRAGWNRRQFVQGLGAAGFVLGMEASPARAESPPETTKLRLTRFPSTCVAPQYMAEELLRGEGFAHVEYPAYGDGKLSSGTSRQERLISACGLASPR